MNAITNYSTRVVVAISAATILLLSSPTSADVRPDRQPGAQEGKRGKKEEKLIPILDREGVKDPVKNVLEEGQENLKEIQKLLDEIQDNLSSRETGAGTQAKQKEVVQKMENLLEQLEQACSKCQGGSGSPEPKPQQGSPKKQEKQDEKKPSGEKKEKDPQKSEAKQQQPDQERDGQADNEKTEDGENPEAGVATLREQMLDVSKRWGILPPKLQEAVLFSSGREAPREYVEIISRYYKRLAESYQRSSER